MIVGVPKEIKRDEYRVGILPVGVRARSAGPSRAGRSRGRAGLRAGRPRLRSSTGPNWSHARSELYRRADMIIKVKEPQPAEIALLRRGQIVFTYFHLAADRELTEACWPPVARPWPTRPCATSTVGCRC